MGSGQSKPSWNNIGCGSVIGLLVVLFIGVAVHSGGAPSEAVDNPGHERSSVPSQTPVFTTHCGQTGVNPPDDVSTSDWASYGCADEAIAEDDWSRCFRYSEYTDDPDRGCRGAERCCPADVVQRYTGPQYSSAEQELMAAEWVHDVYVSPGHMNVGVLWGERDWHSPMIGRWVCAILERHGQDDLVWVRFVDIEAVVNRGETVRGAEISIYDCEYDTIR